MLKVTYSEELRRDPGLSSIATSASEALKQILSKWPHQVEAKWEFSGSDRGRLLLALSDEFGESRTVLDLKSLADSSILESRLRRLWDMVLGNRSDKQMEKLLEVGN